MLLDKQELYKLIVATLNDRARRSKANKLLFIKELGIPQSTWYAMNRYANESFDDNLLSSKRLREICDIAGIRIKNELFEVEIIEDNTDNLEVFAV